MPQIIIKMRDLVRDEIERQAEKSREALNWSLETLRQCQTPDTFLGRKTYHPFPIEGKE